MKCFDFIKKAVFRYSLVFSEYSFYSLDKCEYNNTIMKTEINIRSRSPTHIMYSLHFNQRSFSFQINGE